MTNTNWLEEFRRHLGSKDFKEAPCSTITAQFINHFIFNEAPKEVRLLLFEDFVANFWAEEMPTTDCHYDMCFESIPESVMREIGSHIAEPLKKMMDELIIFRVDAKIFATELFRAMQGIDKNYRTYVINSLILSPISIPYRYVNVDTVITTNDIGNFTKGKSVAWGLIQSLVLGFNADTTNSALVLWELIKSQETQQDCVVAFFLSASEIVFLVTEGKLEMSEEGSNHSVFQKFQDDNLFFLEDCIASVEQARYGHKKFRNFLDQSAYLLSKIQEVEPMHRHLALQTALFAYFIGAKKNWNHLPCRVPIPKASEIN